ncbi:MAG: adenylyl-sulfate kinase [Gammaproteobacteria bacterium]|jgi:adenylylsulfate kinase|nr:adenylyl-sulfate kinase [Gammaproteobacteria bacterium]
MQERRINDSIDRRHHDQDRRSSNVVWQNSEITKDHRNTLNKQKSAILWFTGLSGSGKSTIANIVEGFLHRNEIRTYILDGDNVRHGLNSDLGFSDKDRQENIRRIGEVSKLFIDAGVMVLTSFISPFIEDRQFVRNIVKTHEFIEVYVKCPLNVCEERDIKGLYARARKGEIKHFTGIDSPYESPLNPEITIDTSVSNESHAANIIISYLINNQYIQLQPANDARQSLLQKLMPHRKSVFCGI